MTNSIALNPKYNLKTNAVNDSNNQNKTKQTWLNYVNSKHIQANRIQLVNILHISGSSLQCWKCIAHDCEADPEDNYKASKVKCNDGDRCMVCIIVIWRRYEWCNHIIVFWESSIFGKILMFFSRNHCYQHIVHTRCNKNILCFDIMKANIIAASLASYKHKTASKVLFSDMK